MSIVGNIRFMFFLFKQKCIFVEKKIKLYIFLLDLCIADTYCLP